MNLIKNFILTVKINFNQKIQILFSELNCTDIAKIEIWNFKLNNELIHWLNICASSRVMIDLLYCFKNIWILSAHYLSNLILKIKNHKKSKNLLTDENN